MFEQKQKYECILFDCDGTLIDSEGILARLLAEHIRALGYDFSDEMSAKTFRGCDYHYVKKWLIANLENFPIEKYELQYAQFIKHSDKELPKYLVEIPGAKRLLASLSTYPKCIVSNGHRHVVDSSLKLTELKLYFKDEELFTYELVANAKPAPDLYLHACNKMNVNPKNCIALEDSVVGATAAVAAGITTIGIIAHNENKGLADRLTEVGVHKIIYKLGDFKELIYS